MSAVGYSRGSRLQSVTVSVQSVRRRAIGSTCTTVDRHLILGQADERFCRKRTTLECIASLGLHALGWGTRP